MTWVNLIDEQVWTEYYIHNNKARKSLFLPYVNLLFQKTSDSRPKKHQLTKTPSPPLHIDALPESICSIGGRIF